MLRCDMFMMLSSCQSSVLIHRLKQSKAIRRGITEMVKKTQNLNNSDEILPFFSGWDRQLIYDKCVLNGTTDVQNVNMPPLWGIRRDPS